MLIKVTNIDNLDFPVFDLTYKNKSTNACILNEFRIKIRNIELAESPVLDFVFDVEDKSQKYVHENSTGKFHQMSKKNFIYEWVLQNLHL